MEHEVAPGDVLQHKVQVRLCTVTLFQFFSLLTGKKKETCHGLKAGVKLDEEGRLEMHGQDPPLHHRRLQVIVLHDDVFLQYLDGVDLISSLPLRQHHLPK